VCNNHHGRAQVTDGLSALSSLYCFPGHLLEPGFNSSTCTAVAALSQSCFETKSQFQQAAFKAHLSRTQGHELQKEICNKQQLPWATEQSTWLQMLGEVGLHTPTFFCFPLY